MEGMWWRVHKKHYRNASPISAAGYAKDKCEQDLLEADGRLDISKLKDIVEYARSSQRMLSRRVRAKEKARKVLGRFTDQDSSIDRLFMGLPVYISLPWAGVRYFLTVGVSVPHPPAS